MAFQKIHNKGQARLFKNNVLEFFTKGHPLFIWSMYLPVLILLPVYAHQTHGFSTTDVALLYVSGIFCWTLVEYCLHRFAFHHHPTSNLGKKLNYLIHGNHHEYPRDKQRLFMPPLPSLLIASCFLGVYYAILGSMAYAFFPGFMLGYLLYGSMHYAIHAWNPPFKWMKPLWRNHHLHHYKDGDKGFGVSSTLWDRVFGTMFDLKKEKEDPDKVKDLMF